MELLTGAGHPSKRLKGELGQHYKDTNTGDIWECISSNEHSRIHHQLMGGYIWKKMATGDHIEACNVAANSPSEVVILPETEVAVITESPITTAPNTMPEVGAVCTVTYNGTAYDCPAVATPEGLDISGVVLGNTDAVGIPGGNATAPFVVLIADEPFYVEDGIAYCLLLPQGGTAEGTYVTLSIVEKAETSSTGGGGAFVVTFTVSGLSSDSDGEIYNNPTCDKTSAEIVEAYEAGIPVVGYLDGAGGGVMVVHLTNVDHSMLTFVGTLTSFDDMGGRFRKSLSAVLIRMHDNVVDAARTYTILSY